MQTALLIGAGFSFELGMPLASQLTTDVLGPLQSGALQRINDVWRVNGGDAIAPEIFDEAGSKHDLPYEEFLSWLQERWRTTDDPTKARGYSSLYVQMIEGVSLALFLRHRHRAPFFRLKSRFYSGLTSLARRESPLWIFSLNHDICLELVCAEHGIAHSAGYSEERIRLPLRPGDTKDVRDLKLRVLRRSDLDRKQYFFLPTGVAGINLVKLHGSLDAFRLGDEHHLARLDPEQETIEGWLAALEGINLRVFNRPPFDRIHTTNEIVFSPEGQEEQFLRRSVLGGKDKVKPDWGTNAVPELLELFVSRLSSVERLISIGYSFRDQHINEVLANWLNRNAAHRLTVVDPFAPARPPPFANEQTTELKVSATEALDLEGSVARGPVDLALKEILTTLERLARENPAGLQALFAPVSST